MKRLLIIGGTAVKQNYNGLIKLKYPFKIYIEGLSDYFDQVVWIVGSNIDAPVKSIIDKRNIKIIPYNNNLISCIKTMNLILKILKLDKFYVLIFPSPKLHFVIPLIRKYSLNFVYYIGINPNNIKVNSILKYFGWNFILKYLHIIPFKFSNYIIARGNYLKKFANIYNNNVFKTIPIGYGVLNIKSKKRLNFKVLFIGKILKEKGVFELYDSIKIINTTNVNKISLDFIGDGTSLNKLKQIVKQNESDFVKFHNWIDDPISMEKIMNESDLLVCPSRDEYPEGVPRVINEALNLSMPVLCSDQKTFLEEFKDLPIFFFKTNDTNDLTKKINLFYSNTNFRYKLKSKFKYYFSNLRKITPSKQHAEIILNSQKIKKTNSSKIYSVYASDKFIKSLNSHRNIKYIINRTKEIIFRFVYSDTPWLTPAANKILSKTLKNNFTGFEFGSGKSTIWFSKRIKHITSLETSKIWFNKVLKILKKNNLKNVDLICMDKEEKNFKIKYLNVLSKFNDDYFDFILVDALFRDECTHLAIKKLKPGGFLILDNVNRYLPFDTISPFSIKKNESPLNALWEKIYDETLSKWHTLHTSNGVSDTAIFTKPKK